VAHVKIVAALTVLIALFSLLQAPQLLILSTHEPDLNTAGPLQREVARLEPSPSRLEASDHRPSYATAPRREELTRPHEGIFTERCEEEKGDERKQSASEPEALPGNVTIHPGDLVVRGVRSRLVIRNCKFIIRGSLVVLDGAEALIEDSVVLLDVPSSDHKVSNITVRDSGELKVINSVLGTTGLLFVLRVYVSSSNLMASGSLIANASIQCYDGEVELSNSTIRGHVELQGSSSLLAYEATITSSLAIRHSSSARLTSSSMQHILVEFYRRTCAILRDIRHGYIRSWDLFSNATVGTIYVNLSIRDCHVGSWSLNLTQSAVIALEFSHVWEATAYGYSVLNLRNSSIGEVAIQEHSALWLDDSSANMMRALDNSYVTLTDATVLAMVADDEAEVLVANSSLMSVLALGKPIVNICNSSLGEVCVACSREARLGLGNCLIAERITARAWSRVVMVSCSVEEVEASDHSLVRLFSSYATRLSARGSARIEVWWPLKVCVSLDGLPLQGAVVRIFHKNGTELCSKPTGRHGCAFFSLLCTLVTAYGEEDIQPYFVLVEYELLWASEEVVLTGPTVLPIELEREAEITVRCLDAAGRPLRGAYVSVRKRGAEVDGEVTNPEGTVVIEDLPVGNYTLLVFWRGARVAEDMLFVHGVDDEVVVMCAVFDVVVKVRGPYGPVEGATISLAMVRLPRVHFTGITNASGVAVLMDVPIGDYELFVQAEGYTTHEAVIKVREQWQLIEVELEEEQKPPGPPIWLVALLAIPVVALPTALYLKRRRKGA